MSPPPARTFKDPRRPEVHDEAELSAALAPGSAEKLLQVHLHGPNVTEGMVATLARRGDLTTVKCVSLIGGALGDVALTHLARGPLVRSLRLLVLDHAGVTAEGLSRLARAPTTLPLAELALFNRDGPAGVDNRIDDAALGALARGTALPSLETLDLTYTPCTAAGIAALAASTTLPALRQITAWRTGLTAEGVASLKGLRFRLFSDFDHRVIDYSSE